MAKSEKRLGSLAHSQVMREDGSLVSKPLRLPEEGSTSMPRGSTDSNRRMRGVGAGGGEWGWGGAEIIGTELKSRRHTHTQQGVRDQYANKCRSQQNLGIPPNTGMCDMFPLGTLGGRQKHGDVCQPLVVEGAPS